MTEIFGGKDMKNSLVLVLLISALIALPGWALAEIVEGTVQGFTCVTAGKVCPVGKEDPMVASEKIFVILAMEKGKYYFVPNVDRAVLARHINQMVRVTGQINPNYPSIRAEKLEVMQKAPSWQTTWSTAMQEEAEAWIRQFYQHLPE
jgi:hypothetical protein